MCWAIPPGSGGGENTVTLVSEGWMHEISPSQLQPGDAVGVCGPGSSGNAGHIVLFEKWYNADPNDSRYWMYEQAGGQRGPIHRAATYPYGGSVGSWKSYRFKDITDPGIAEEDEMPVGMGPIQLPRGPNAHESYSIWPVNSGSIPWGPAFASIFADLYGGKAAFRIALGDGGGRWTVVSEKLIIESGRIRNMSLPTGTRGLSITRLPVSDGDPCTESVSMSIEYSARQ